MTFDEFTEIYESAARLERAKNYASARDAFLVAGDAAEEIGNMDYARKSRQRAMANHVTAWAKCRWPKEAFYVHDAEQIGEVSDEWTHMSIRRYHDCISNNDRYLGSYLKATAYVSVGRRGDVRLEHESDRARERAERLGVRRKKG